MTSRPFDEMDRVFEQMDRAFDEMRARWSASDESGYFGGLTHDWQATEDAHTLVVDLPGFEREELEVSAFPGEGYLVIDAEREVEGDGRQRRVHERVSLPSDADVEDVTATYRNGVLELAFGRTGEDDASVHIDID